MDKLGINLLNHHENTALIVKNEKDQKVTNGNLLKQVLKTSLFIEAENIQKYTTVGFYGHKSYPLVAVILGVIESGNTFCYITKDDLNEGINVDFFFSLSIIHQDTVELVKHLLICDTTVYFYRTKNATTFKSSENVCYRITTSGTTGRKKLIHVTFDSIYPNIKSLQQIFQLDRNDVILSASPVTFDVFFVDLFLSLHTGACLLFMTDRFNTSIFSKVANIASVTFLQMTPTIFRQYGLENIKNKILHAESSLKYLVLGGEEFPSPKEVLTWQNWNNKGTCKRIFNIYGITEMSCWAMIHEVSKEDLEFGKIPLGTALDSDTLPAFYPHTNEVEELILTTSSRINFFDDNKDLDRKLGTDCMFAYVTNDLVKKINGKIYWYGRSNDIVKRYGERVDLRKIEDLASEIIQPVSCIMIKKRIALFYQSNHDDVSQLLSNHLKLKLKKAEYPDDLKRIDFLPTCEHGKVSKTKLKELYKDILKEDKVKQSAEDIFLDTINQMFNLKLEKPHERMGDEPDGKRTKHDIDSTFQQIGGSSFDALRIVMKIEDKLSTMSNALLPKLLDNSSTIKDVLSYLKDINFCAENNSKAEATNGSSSTTAIKIFKKFHLEKCVDSTPSLITVHNQNFIVVGGHSGNLMAINSDNLSVESTVKLPDRIECEATKFRDCIVVGCYDGFLYCVDFLEKNRIKFKYNSGAMIKSKPLVINDEFIIIGNYNYEKNVRCLQINENMESVEEKWSKLLGSSGIIANILKIDDESIFACALDGTVERMKINCGSTIWNKKFEYPIFSSPQVLKQFKAIIFAEVMTKVHCMDFDGNSLWNFDTEGHIFSSFIFTPIDDNSTKILFGCHDNKLRCLKYSNFATVSKEWETKLQSQIYNTPKIINLNNPNMDFVVSCSTNGYVNVINSLSGKIEYSLKLPGEIFSSPLIYKDKIFIGCRDNYVYCLSFNTSVLNY